MTILNVTTNNHPSENQIYTILATLCFLMGAVNLYLFFKRKSKEQNYS